MPKKKITKTKKTFQKGQGWFFAHRAPDLPFWVFLTLGALALAVFASWLKPSNKPVSSSSSLSPSSSSSLTPTKTTTIANASDPSLVAHSNKLYLTFRNNIGGYSVAVYDENLTQLEAPRWITNGFAIPNQIVGSPHRYFDTWYFAYLGSDGYTRLANFDANFNPRRTITFKTPLTTLKSPTILVCLGAKSLVVNLFDKNVSRAFDATYDMGIVGDREAPKMQPGNAGCYAKSNFVKFGNKTITAETSGASVILKLNP